MKLTEWDSINAPDWRNECSCLLHDVNIPKPDYNTKLTTKTNLFPPSKLKYLNIEFKIIERTNVRGCGVSILDLIKDALTSLSSHAALSQNGPRRSKSERKKDWDYIIDSVIGCNSEDTRSNLSEDTPILSSFCTRQRKDHFILLHKLPKFDLKAAKKSTAEDTVERILQKDSWSIQEHCSAVLNKFFRNEHVRLPDANLFLIDGNYNRANISGSGDTMWNGKSRNKRVVFPRFPILSPWNYRSHESQINAMVILTQITTEDATCSFIMDDQDIYKLSSDYMEGGMIEIREHYLPSSHDAIMNIVHKYASILSFINEESGINSRRDFSPSSFESQLTKNSISVFHEPAPSIVPSISCMINGIMLCSKLEQFAIDFYLFIDIWDEFLDAYSGRKVCHNFLWSEDSRFLVTHIKGEFNNIVEKMDSVRIECLHLTEEFSHSKVSFRGSNKIHDVSEACAILEPLSRQCSKQVVPMIQNTMQYIQKKFKPFKPESLECKENSLNIFNSDEDYDTPRRRRNICEKELVLSLYEDCKIDISKSQTRAELGVTQERYEPNIQEADYQMDDIELLDSLKHEDNNMNALDEIIQLHTSLDPDRTPQSGGGSKKNPGDDMLDTENKARLDSTSGSRRIQIPKNLMCSSWSVSAARAILCSLGKGILLTPPSLSNFPIVAILVQSHLFDSEHDRRVAVVVDQNEDVASGVFAYLSDNLDNSISLKLLRRCQYPSQPEMAYIGSPPSRVIIFDGSHFQFNLSFTFLIVLVSDSRGSYSWGTTKRTTLFTSKASRIWAEIPSMIVLPVHPWVLLSEFLLLSKFLADKWIVEYIFLITEIDDVEDCSLLAEPRLLFLVPSRETNEFLGILDKYAAPHLASYINLKQDRGCSKWTTSSSQTSLTSISLHILAEEAQKFKWRSYSNSTTISILHTLKQARSYAKYDGVETAFDFLNHVVKTMKGLVKELAQKLLIEAESLNIFPDFIKSVEDRHHPLLQSLAKELNKAKNAFKDEPLSTKSIHRRDKFRVLIVTNSEEAANGVERGIFEIDGEEVLQTEVDVANLNDMRTSSKNGRHKQSSTLDQYSHVFHIPDDREGNYPDGQLPHSILQQFYAARTRLLTIIVDETRSLEDDWNENCELYAEICRHLVERVNDENQDDMKSYMVKISCVKAWETLRVHFPALFSSPQQKQLRSSKDVHPTSPMHFQSGRTGSPARMSLVDNDICPQLHLTAAGVCRLSRQSLQAVIRRNLKDHKKQAIVHYFKVLLHVSRKEKCTPTASCLISAILNAEDLYDSVHVVTIFDT